MNQLNINYMTDHEFVPRWYVVTQNPLYKEFEPECAYVWFEVGTYQQFLKRAQELFKGYEEQYPYKLVPENMYFDEPIKFKDQFDHKGEYRNVLLTSQSFDLNDRYTGSFMTYEQYEEEMSEDVLGLIEMCAEKGIREFNKKVKGEIKHEMEWKINLVVNDCECSICRHLDDVDIVLLNKHNLS